MSHCGLCGKWIDDCDRCKRRNICDRKHCTEWSICEDCLKRGNSEGDRK